MKFMSFGKIGLNTSVGCVVNYLSQSQPIYLRFTEKVRTVFQYGKQMYGF